MMRNRQNYLQRKASRKAISQNASGIFGLIRLFNRFQLMFSLFALALSVILLFFGTYVYFDSNTIKADNSNNLNPIYEHILHFYGINETDFTMLYPLSKHENIDQFQLKNYQIEISMMFVAVISILIEVGVICSIIFEHFKLSLLYNLIMISGLIYGLSGSNAHVYFASLAFQVIFLVTFCFFSMGIKVKWFAANRILKHNEFELNNDQNCTKA